jgi:hypothetical protein
MHRTLLATALAIATTLAMLAPTPAAAQVSAQCPNVANIERNYSNNRLRCWVDAIVTAQTICPPTHPIYNVVNNGRDFCATLNVLVPPPPPLSAPIACQGPGYTSANIVNDAGAGARDLCRREQRNYLPPVIVP